MRFHHTHAYIPNSLSQSPLRTEKNLVLAAVFLPDLSPSCIKKAHKKHLHSKNRKQIYLNMALETETER